MRGKQRSAARFGAKKESRHKGRRGCVNHERGRVWWDLFVQRRNKAYCPSVTANLLLTGGLAGLARGITPRFSCGE